MLRAHGFAPPLPLRRHIHLKSQFVHAFRSGNMKIVLSSIEPGEGESGEGNAREIVEMKNPFKLSSLARLLRVK